MYFSSRNAPLKSSVVLTVLTLAAAGLALRATTSPAVALALWTVGIGTLFALLWRLNEMEKIVAGTELVSDLAGVVFAIYDSGRELIYANYPGATIFGGSPVDGLARLADDGRDEVAPQLAAIADAYKARRALTVDLNLRVDGEPETWRISCFPVNRNIVFVAEDISAAHAVLTAVKGDLTLLREFVDTLPVGLFRTDNKGRFIFANRTLQEWMKTETPDDYRMQDFVYSGAIPELDGVWQGNVALAALPHEDNRSFAAYLAQAPEDSGDTYAGAVVRGAVAELEFNRTLEDSKRKFLWLFESAPIGIAFIDAKGIVKDCNACLLDTLHIRDNVIDSHFTYVIDTPEKAQLNAAFAKVVNGESDAERYEIPFKRITEDGKTLAMHLMVYFTPMESGNRITGVICFIVDTSEHKNLERQFVQAQRLQAMGQFAGGIAHDFNNLLTAILGYCELLRQRHNYGDPSFPEIMQIHSNALRAGNLVRQLLAFSRKQPLAPKLLSVGALITDILPMLRSMLGERIEFNIERSGPPGLVKVDATQFQQVIMNLAINARDAMPGGGRLDIRTRLEDVRTPVSVGAEEVPEGIYQTVEIEDTGCGIAKENLARIFDPFFSTKENVVGSGTGLGLSTVFGIIRQSGGYIGVTSKVDVGTTFKIYLPDRSRDADKGDEITTSSDIPTIPLKRSPSIQVQTRIMPADVPQMTLDLDDPGKTKPIHVSRSDMPSRSARILLAEDEEVVRAFVVQALKNKGYEVVSFPDGESALDWANSGEAFDLLLTDMVMPGISGLELAMQVREIRAGTPVLVMSGYSEDIVKEGFPELPKFDFLKKPFALRDLTAKVKDAVEQSDSSNI